MIIQCNSCLKSFNVPDGAITSAGRLVQCSSCGNKWTQFPLKKEKPKSGKIIPEPKKIITKIEKKVVKNKKKKKVINPYSEDYLKKKHGIRIINPSSLKIKDKKKSISQNIGFGFYNYLVTFVIFSIFIVRGLYFGKDFIIINYPFLEIHLNNFFETLNNLKLIILDIIKKY
ncbi:MAG: zinc-ribbon domain-containing protein [Pelagibacteraceae bacterium]